MRLFPRLLQVRQQRAQLRVLVRRGRRFTPGVAADVAALARSDPDAALATFVSASQREHFELDEAVCEKGFDFWVDAAAEFIPLLMRSTDYPVHLDPTALERLTAWIDRYRLIAEQRFRGLDALLEAMHKKGEQDDT
jgi:hypothetical protein